MKVISYTVLPWNDGKIGPPWAMTLTEGNRLQIARQLKLLVAISLLSSSVLAETLKDTAAARALTDRIMTKVGTGDIVGGIQLSRPFLMVPKAEFDVMLDQLKMQQPMIAQRFGETIGYEFIREEKIGENLLRIVHIHRFDKHAMRWSFYFYRGGAGWVLNTFKTDDDIRLIFGA